MLVLSRKPGQVIFIKDKQGNVLITVSIVKVKQSRVTLGFVAGEEFIIERDNFRKKEE